MLPSTKKIFRQKKGGEHIFKTRRVLMTPLQGRCKERQLYSRDSLIGIFSQYELYRSRCYKPRRWEWISIGWWFVVSRCRSFVRQVAFLLTPRLITVRSDKNGCKWTRSMKSLVRKKCCFRALPEIGTSGGILKNRENIRHSVFHLNIKLNKNETNCYHGFLHLEFAWEGKTKQSVNRNLN